MNVIRVETEKKRTRYKGEYAQLASWKRDFIAELKSKNKLAAAIVQGDVQVEKETTTSIGGALYTCAMGVMTHFMLAVMTIMAVGEEETNKVIDSKVYLQREKPY